MNDVGIITFHCSDNYGAMLQAYGLKEYLRSKNIRTDIVQYEPPFMTGRHWWIPYIPIGGLLGIIYYGCNIWINNLKLRRNFFIRRHNMKEFRRKYLTEGKRKKAYFAIQLRKFNYQCYIVGSDQIWNPDITCGLRKVYFGDFKNKKKKRVIAYAASMGRAALSPEYDKEFSKLLNHLDAISVRESGAIPYIKRFYRGDVQSVLDPVFLLEEKEWQKVEKIPDKERFIFVYMTEHNDKLGDYVKRLSKEKGMLIVRICGGINIAGENVWTDYVAGPAEFLGYVHKADYVVTNSFHGVAFSMIFKKKFVVFQHSSVGERISNLLELSGLESRIYRGNEEMDFNIDWNTVRERIEKNIELAEDFLMRNIG